MSNQTPLQMQDVRRIHIIKEKEVKIKKKRICHGCDSWMKKGRKMMFSDVALNGNNYVRVYHCKCCYQYATRGPGVILDLFEQEPGSLVMKETYPQFAIDYWTQRLTTEGDTHIEGLYTFVGHLVHLVGDHTAGSDYRRTHNPQRGQIFVGLEDYGLDFTTKQRGMHEQTVETLRTRRARRSGIDIPNITSSVRGNSINSILDDTQWATVDLSQFYGNTLADLTNTGTTTSTTTSTTNPFIGTVRDTNYPVYQRYTDQAIGGVDRATHRDQQMMSVREDNTVVRRERPLLVGDVYTEHGTNRPLGIVTNVSQDYATRQTVYDFMITPPEAQRG